MKILCFGDSNTYGYDARELIDNRYPAEYRWVDILARMTGWTVINKGMNGREIPGSGISVPEDTDLLVVMLGTNDILQGNDEEIVAARMSHFLKMVDFPREKILLVSPVPMQYGAWVTDQAIVVRSQKLASFYAALAEKNGIHFADAGEWAVDLSHDGIHYSEEGQIAYARGIYSCIISNIIR